MCLNFSSALSQLGHLGLLSVSYVLKRRKQYLAYSIATMAEVIHKMLITFPPILSHLSVTFHVLLCGSHSYPSMEIALPRSQCHLCYEITGSVLGSFSGTLTNSTILKHFFTWLPRPLTVSFSLCGHFFSVSLFASWKLMGLSFCLGSSASSIHPLLLLYTLAILSHSYPRHQLPSIYRNDHYTI